MAKTAKTRPHDWQGRRMLIDSNLIIYALQPQYGALQEWIIDNEPQYSIISHVEVLGFARIQALEKQAITDFLSNLTLIYLNENCYKIAIDLKQQRKMTLGDALIAATCIEHKKVLATRNTDDFTWIKNLEVINPLEMNCR
jgi:predicted nucleic acid-binding protein